MSPCPYCGEAIALEARLCRYCNRPTLYQIHIGPLSEREAHDFFKQWSTLEKKDFNWAILSNSKEARQKLGQGRFLLGWNCHKQKALELQDRLKPTEAFVSLHHGVAMSGAGLPSHDTTPLPSTRTFPSSLVVLALVTLMAAWSFREPLIKTLRSQISTHSEPVASTESDVLDLSEISIPWSSETHKPLDTDSPSVWNPQSMAAVLDATVFISDETSLGSGFLITPDGTILTNYHVISKMNRPQVSLRDGRKFEGQIISSLPNLDLSLVKISGSHFPTLEIGNANDLYPGQSILTVGNPGGLSFTVTRGIVSYVGREINGIPYIQTDAAINRGNSGGPMITDDRKVVGINTLTSLKEQGISFALPINLACQPGAIASQFIQCSYFAKGPSHPAPAMSRHNDESQPIITYYKKLFEDLKSSWKSSDDSLKLENQKLKARIKALQTEVRDAYSSQTTLERLAQEQKDAQVALEKNNRERLERQARYLRQVVNILERQRGEKIFEQSTAAITQQIDSLRSKEREILNQLN